MWSTSLSRVRSGTHLQTQKGMQNTSWEQTGVPVEWKSIHRSTQNSRASPEPLEWEHWRKTLGSQRTNPREYQTVRMHTNESTWIKTRYHLTNSSTLCRTPHLNKKQNKNTDPSISRQDDHLTQPGPSEEKQTKAQHRSHPIGSSHKPLDQP